MGTTAVIGARPITNVVLSGALALSGTNAYHRDPIDPAAVRHTFEGFASHDPASVVATGSIAAPTALTSSVETIQSETRWRDYVSRRLGQLMLGDGDFTGLMQPTRSVISHAREVADRLFQPDTPTPSVVPTEDGEVLFAWHKGGWQLEIAIGSEEVTVWARESSSGIAYSGSLADYSHEITALLVRLSRL